MPKFLQVNTMIGFDRTGLTQVKESNWIVYVGRLIGYKKVEQVLELVLRLRRLGLDVRADIVGDGPERVPLESLASKMGVTDSVRFWGLLLRWDGCGWNRSNGIPTLQRIIVEA